MKAGLWFPEESCLAGDGARSQLKRSRADSSRLAETTLEKFVFGRHDRRHEAYRHGMSGSNRVNSIPLATRIKFVPARGRHYRPARILKILLSSRRRIFRPTGAERFSDRFTLENNRACGRGFQPARRALPNR